MNNEILAQANEVSKSYRQVNRGKSFFDSLKNIWNPSYTEKEALKTLSFSIKRGEIVGLLGPNGAGKSTFVKILCGLIVPTNGNVAVMGHDPSDKDFNLKHHLGVIFGQKSSLWWDLSIKENIKIFAAIYNKQSVIDQEWIEQLITRLDLKHVIDTPIRNLSLGERVKSELVSVLLYKPTLLVLDEPTIGLDVTSKKEIRTLLKELASEQGMSILLTSHDMVDIESCCQRVVIIDKGEKIFEGSISNLRKQIDPLKTIIVRLPIQSKENELNLESIIKNKLEYLSNKYPLKISISNSLVETLGCIYPNNGVSEDSIIQIDLEEKYSSSVLGVLLGIENDLDIEIRPRSLESLIVKFFKDNKEASESRTGP
ncbi:MAG: ATP-binding cassette domain-containing protein [Pseudomonadota bacterium]